MRHLPMPESHDPAEITHYLVVHDTLNPKLWSGRRLRLDVRVRLLRIAIAFYRFLDVPGLRIEDIVLTGSNAAYNYTDLSDVDVHLVADFSTVSSFALAENLFTTKKALWNERHDITIRGQPVEMYVEDISQRATSNGVYSILRGSWVARPRRDPPTFDDMAVVAKTNAFVDEIEAMMAGTPDRAAIDALMDRLRRYRRAGLAAGGEFSVENLTFKSLRNLGYMDRLHALRTAAEDADLTLETR